MVNVDKIKLSQELYTKFEGKILRGKVRKKETIEFLSDYNDEKVKYGYITIIPDDFPHSKLRLSNYQFYTSKEKLLKDG